jgi:hypothetical protein
LYIIFKFVYGHHKIAIRRGRKKTFHRQLY